MNTNINIPITNEQAIVLSGSTTSSGGYTLDIDYITGVENIGGDITMVYNANIPNN